MIVIHAPPEQLDKMSVNLKPSDIVKNLPSLDFELGLSEIANDL